MSETNLTDEQREKVKLFCSGMSLAMYYAYEYQSGVSILELDFLIRKSMVEQGVKDDELEKSYFEYVCGLIVHSRDGTYRRDEHDKLIGDVASIAVGNILNAQSPIEVAVMPHPDEEITVPEEWTSN
jgi:hypothetical protein